MLRQHVLTRHTYELFNISFRATCDVVRDTVNSTTTTTMVSIDIFFFFISHFTHFKHETDYIWNDFSRMNFGMRLISFLGSLRVVNSLRFLLGIRFQVSTIGNQWQKKGAKIERAHNRRNDVMIYQIAFMQHTFDINIETIFLRPFHFIKIIIYKNSFARRNAFNHYQNEVKSNKRSDTISKKKTRTTRFLFVPEK